MELQTELAVAKRLATAAEQAILEIYQEADFGVQMKHEEDRESPLTKADLAADKIITAGLREAFPDDGLLTEESNDDKSRLSKDRVWIVDPLDGTKEFVSRNGEFTVNIGLTIKGEPVLGVIAVPAKGLLYSAVKGAGASVERDGKEEPITVSTNKDPKQMTLVVSRSHRTAQDDAFSAKAGFAATQPSGSSMKGCRVAEGSADVYLRSGPQCEWDVCAMNAIIIEAGGAMTGLDGKPLVYNQENTLFTGGFLLSNNTIHQELLRLIT